jgi:DnaJ domain
VCAMTDCHYTVLQVKRNATASQIKKSYKGLALQRHPDKNGGSDKAFKALNEAYTLLHAYYIVLLPEGIAQKVSSIEYYYNNVSLFCNWLYCVRPLAAIEELIHSLVRQTPGDGYAPLLPHTNAAVYFKAGHNQGWPQSASGQHVQQLKGDHW